MSDRDVTDRFKSHAINGEAKILIEGFREEYQELAHLINERLPDSREKSIVLTKLEEASFFTVAAIARNRAMDDVAGWVHDDGTPCPEFLAPTPRALSGPPWWCTTHQQYVHTAPSTTTERDMQIVDSGSNEQ